MRGLLDVREIEDVEDNTLSLAEVKAILSGNPLMLEKSKADQELARLERLNWAWHRIQSSLVFRKDAALSPAETLERELPVLCAAVQLITDELDEERFRMTIDEATYVRSGCRRGTGGEADGGFTYDKSVPRQP